MSHSFRNRVSDISEGNCEIGVNTVSQFSNQDFLRVHGLWVFFLLFVLKQYQHYAQFKGALITGTTFVLFVI